MEADPALAIQIDNARATLASGDPVPRNHAEAMELAMLWATGKRSHDETLRLRARDHDSMATLVGTTIIANAAEASKWATIAQAMAAGDRSVLLRATVDVDRLRSKVADLIDAVERLPDEVIRPGDGR